MREEHKARPNKGRFVRVFDWIVNFRDYGKEGEIKRTFKFSWPGKKMSKVEIWTWAPMGMEYAFFELTEEELGELHDTISQVVSRKKEKEKEKRKV